MQTLTEQLFLHPLRERILDESQLARVVGGSPARRYGLVNRALQAGELQRLKRGLYVLLPLTQFAQALGLSTTGEATVRSAPGSAGQKPYGSGYL